MPVVTDSTIASGNSESITGYRSSSVKSDGASVKNTCDIPVYAYDPFDFTVDYRPYTVRVKHYYYVGRVRRYKYVKHLISYPFYNFVQKKRTVKQWRMELKAGLKVLGVSPIALPHINARIATLQTKLRKYGKCRDLLPRSAHIQHEVTHWSTTISGFNGDGEVPYTFYGQTEPLVVNTYYGYRAYELDHEVFEGITASGDNSELSALMQSTTLNQPLSQMTSNETVSLMASLLWPSSDDYASRDASPLVDLAEAASDGVFPLGPPPSATEAHKRMVDSMLPTSDLSTIREVIDFSANSWLWTTLVLEPVIGAAVGLSASVQANDDAIEAYQKSVRSGKWFQGKSFRLFGKNPVESATCFGAPLEHISTVGGTACTNADYGEIKHRFEYKKFEGNASMVYKPSFAASSNMNTSGQRLASFFNRLSTDLDKVLYNLVPLSFVTDWFTTEYSGKLNLDDKVYMPIDDWKVITSFKMDVALNTHVHHHTNSSTLTRRYKLPNKIYYPSCYSCVANNWNPPVYAPIYRSSTQNYNGGNCGVTGDYGTCGSTPYGTGLTKLEVTKYSQNVNLDYQEDHKYYGRFVFNRPPRSTTNDFSYFDCRDTDKGGIDDLLEGQQITLGALIWGAVSRIV